MRFYLPERRSMEHEWSIMSKVEENEDPNIIGSGENIPSIVVKEYSTT